MGITLSRYTHFVIVHHTFSNSSFDHKPHENHTYLIRTLIYVNSYFLIIALIETKLHIAKTAIRQTVITIKR